MTKITQADLDQLLSQTHYAWNTSVMLAGVIDFLEFSENNLAWQREREMKKAKLQAEAAQFAPEDEHLEDSYRQHLVGNVEYWFDVSLSQRVRYAGLVAFVTSLEWSSRGLLENFTRKPPKTPNRENPHVHFLAHIDDLSKGGFGTHIDDLRRLVLVRDCVVHSAGFLGDRKYHKDIREAVKSLKGFRVWDENYLGTSVHLEKGAVDRYAASAREWMPKLVERCVKTGVIRG